MSLTGVYGLYRTTAEVAARPGASLHQTRNGKAKAMLLENKVAIIYGAGGAIGGAVARTFAREGAKVFLLSRLRVCTMSPLTAAVPKL
jgi:predicted amino acid dehydrogenase